MDQRLDQTLRQARAAINLLVQDPAERRALYGHAVAMVTAESSAGLHLRRPGSGFIGPFQMNKQHALAIRNQDEGVQLNQILRAQERLPPEQRSPDAQLLLNAGATRGPWMVNGRDMHQDQGVLGGVSTVIAARVASRAAETPITDLSASQVWVQHKLGWYGGAAIVRAAENNPTMRVGDVRIPEAENQAINPRHIRSNFGTGPNTSVASIMARTDAKFEARVDDPGVIGRLSRENRALFAEATGISPERVEQAAVRQAPAATQVAGGTEQTPDRNTIVARQQGLIAAGHDLGPRGADGVWGRRSQQADAAYKQATGKTIAETLQAQPVAPTTQVAAAGEPRATPAQPTQAAPSQATQAAPAITPVAALDDAPNRNTRQATGRVHLDKALGAAGLNTASEVDALRNQRGLRDASPSQMQAALRDDVRAIQRELKDAGFNVGRADGLVGARTERALAAFREQRGAEPQAIGRIRASATPNEREVQASIPKPELAPPPSGIQLTAQIAEDNRRLAAAQQAASETKLNETGTRGGESASAAEPKTPTQVVAVAQNREGRGAGPV